MVEVLEDIEVLENLMIALKEGASDDLISEFEAEYAPV